MSMLHIIMYEFSFIQGNLTKITFEIEHRFYWPYTLLLFTSLPTYYIVLNFNIHDIVIDILYIYSDLHTRIKFTTNIKYI